jgi:glucosyl-dolichyl phosphate glucuronosyltransferase
MQKNNSPILSVVVCTYNRAPLLEMCLRSLVEQSASSSLHEIIIVDNNSSDSTPSVVKEFSQKYDYIHGFIEKNQGLSHSRNRGYREASGEYVAYIDDDAKASENWIESAVQIIQDKNPDIFGGPIYPFYLSPKPDWFEDKYETRIHHGETGWVPKDRRKNLSGSNVFLKKSILQQLGGFKVNLGMSGTEIGYGEETEIIARARNEGRNVYYSLALIVYHLVPERKMRLWYHIYANYKGGKDRVNVWKTEFDSEDIFELAGMIDAMIRNINEFISRKDKDDTGYIEKFIVEEYKNTIWGIGKRIGYLLKSNETAEIRSILNASPGDSYINMKDYLVLHSKLLKRTKFIRSINSLLRRK